MESREITNIDKNPRIRKSGNFIDQFHTAGDNPRLRQKPFRLSKITDTDLSLERKMKNQTSLVPDTASNGRNLTKGLPRLQIMSSFGEDLAQPYYNQRSGHSYIATILSDRFENTKKQHLQKRKDETIKKEIFRKINHLDKIDTKRNFATISHRLQATGLKEHFEEWKQTIGIDEPLPNWRGKSSKLDKIKMKRGLKSRY